MKLIITGATGMVGKGVLLECLESKEVESVLVVSRNATNIKHAKLKEILVQDLNNLNEIRDELTGYDACLFCIGISSFGTSESDYKFVTYDLPLNFAKTLLDINQEMNFCYVSASGADKNGKALWQRIKGETESALLALPFKHCHMFRPAYIQPLKGIKSRTAIYNMILPVTKLLYPAIKWLFPKYTTTTSQIGVAMLKVAKDGFSQPILESPEINSIS